MIQHFHLFLCIQWGLELDEDNELQINMSGLAIGFVERGKRDDLKKKDSSTDREMVFSMEEVHQCSSSIDSSQDKSLLLKSKPLRPAPLFCINAK